MTVATLAMIEVAEYLKTMYHPDCDYIDGEVRGRSAAETLHSGLQAYLGTVLWVNRKAWSLRPFMEQRLQISATRFRVADICAVQIPGEAGGIVHDAPVVCIEILSPDDSLTDMQERVEDYLGMGVGNIWLIDPVRRRFWTATKNGIHPLMEDRFSIGDSPVVITLAEINAELDDIAAGRQSRD